MNRMAATRRTPTPTSAPTDVGIDGMPDGPGGSSAAIASVGLTKRFGSFTALDDVTLAVEHGEVFGLLGPNGAGKSTWIRTLMGMLTPTSGTARLAGFDPIADGVAARRCVAYLPGDARLPTHQRADAVMRFFADVHPAGCLERSRGVARRLGLATRHRVGSMSTGMRQKLALAVVLGLDTPLLILDEPTANLDPSVRGEVLAMVDEAAAAGRTVVLSSHVMSEIEDTCSRVAFLKSGRVVRQLHLSELHQRHRITAVGPVPAVPGDLYDNVRVSNDPKPANRLRIETSGDLATVLPWLAESGLTHIRIEPVGLRTVYDEVHRS